MILCLVAIMKILLNTNLIKLTAFKSKQIHKLRMTFFLRAVTKYESQILKKIIFEKK